MTHRERFLAAAKHESPDRAVFDLVGCPQTLIDSVEVRDGLASLLNISDPDHSKYGLDERVLKALDIDTRRVGGMPFPATSHNRVEGDIRYNCFGIGERYMDDHWEMCDFPLKDKTLEEVEDYEFPNPDKVDNADLERWARDAEMLHTQTDYAVIAEHPVLGVFELGCWMFGFDDYLYRLLAEPEVVLAFSDRVLDYQKKVIRKYYSALGAYIDCTTSGDDFGTQKSTFMSVPLFNERIAPYLKERISYTKSLTGALYQHHTCGSVYDLIPSLMDCGVDILNPIQPGTNKMEPERLKESFGDKIAFWGGVDTQWLLSKGTPENVRTEVFHLLSVLDKNGGYILSPAHTIQRDVPPENLLAVYLAAKEYYGC